MVKVLDCGPEVYDFERQSHNLGLLPFRKCVNPQLWVNKYVLFFYKDVFGIKLPTHVDMPFNKKTTPSRLEQEKRNCKLI